jgi:hypothetical protein
VWSMIENAKKINVDEISHKSISKTKFNWITD